VEDAGELDSEAGANSSLRPRAVRIGEVEASPTCRA